jgi:deoxyadenosine/deoxycytidine kinase
MNRHPVVIIEGLIGCGKSSLATELGSALHPNCLTLLEPDEVGNLNPYLQDFYGDMHRWGYTMQTHLLAFRYRQQLRAQQHAMAFDSGGPAILDRSFYGDTCFAKMLTHSGHMEQREFETYALLYQAMTAHVLLPTVCIRIMVDPKTAQQRIAKRYELREGRKAESVIDLAYLQALDREIAAMVNILRRQGVLVLDVPWDTERDTQDQRRQAVQSLAHHINSHAPSDIFLELHGRVA